MRRRRDDPDPTAAAAADERRALVRRRRPVERLRHVVEERARRSLARRGNPLYLDLSAGARVQGGRVERGRAGGGVRGRDGDREDGLLTALDALVDGLGETAPVAATGRQRREQPTVRVEVRDLVAERLHQRDVVGDGRAAEVVRDAAQQRDVAHQQVVPVGLRAGVVVRPEAALASWSSAKCALTWTGSPVLSGSGRKQKARRAGRRSGAAASGGVATPPRGSSAVVGEQQAVEHLAAKTLEQLIDDLARRHLLRTSTIRDFMNSKNYAGP